jgi:branched-chain amino acid transport system permease protein
VDFGSPAGRYLLTLGIVTFLTWVAWNIVHSPVGRAFQAVRDLETAARAMGVPLLRTKLIAFAVSSFYCGVAGSLWAFAYLGTVEPHGLDLTRSFQVLFIIIIGGLGSVGGSFLGAFFVVLLPILLDHLVGSLLSGIVDPSDTENLQKVIFGVLILVILIKEPEGLVRFIEARASQALTRFRAVLRPT